MIWSPFLFSLGLRDSLENLTAHDPDKSRRAGGSRLCFGTPAGWCGKKERERRKGKKKGMGIPS
jgi:hypothetical protein